METCKLFIFGVQVDDNLLCLGIANEISAAYSFLYLSNLYFCHTLTNEYFVKGFLKKPASSSSHIWCEG